MPSEISASTSSVEPRSRPVGATTPDVAAVPGPAGALPMGVLGVAFCTLPVMAWLVSGHWVPEAMVFGLSAGLVALVSRRR